MASHKAVRHVIALVLLYYSLETQADRQPRHLPPEELTDEQVSHFRARTTRELKNLTEIEVVLEIRVPVAGVPPDFTDLLRQQLRNVSLPNTITKSVVATEVNLTTVCKPDTTGVHQCNCEDQFGWSCDKCVTHDVCNSTVAETCGCTNGLPYDGQFCEPITGLTLCQLSTTQTTPSATPTQTVTTMIMTTTATATTTTTTMDPTTSFSVLERNLEFSMDLEFNPSFNNPDHEMFKEIDAVIKAQSEMFINNLISAELKKLRSGSVIAEYTIRATSFEPGELPSVENGISSQLGEKFNIITPSPTPLSFTPNQIFAGEPVTVTCGPPPDSLNFRENWTAEWKINEKPITVRHQAFKQNGQAKLTVTPAFLSDSGTYQCFLRDRTVFLQTGSLSVKPVPAIQVNPIRTNVKCENGSTTRVLLQCSVQSPYRVQLKDGDEVLVQGSSSAAITHNYEITDCENQEKQIICEEQNNRKFKETLTVDISPEAFTCLDDDDFGSGRVGDTAKAACKPDEEGEKTAVCEESGEWGDRQDSCILRVLLELLSESQFLDEIILSDFLGRLSIVTLNFTERIVESPADIGAIVKILEQVANVSQSIPINQNQMTDILTTVDVLVSDGAKESWDFLNANATRNSSAQRSASPEPLSASSALLLSLETVSNALSNDSFEIATPLILLNKTAFTGSFSADLNSSVLIDISVPGDPSSTITTITFASMDNVLPARNASNSTINTINGNVVLVNFKGSINNVSFSFDIINETLGNPQCVFWNFSLFNGLGGWDDEGCELVSNANETVTCNCNHLTSFSILMSAFIPKEIQAILAYITYIGVGISLGCLVICLIIEAIIWKKVCNDRTLHFYHVSIVNIAVCLLNADIWFIIAAAISSPNAENPPACSAATFFIHLFYLALFFWMLASALYVLNYLVYIFHRVSSEHAMAIGFSLGYGAPLIIAIITIAVTAPNKQYVQRTGVCWLNWNESKALLAFVIPALLIVAINLFILVVVMCKIFSSRQMGNATAAQGNHVLLSIARNLVFLTPLFGTTWCLGIGTMISPRNEGIHIAFAVFNSLQGFFILVFATLLDKKSRSALVKTLSTITSGTTSTNTGTTSSSGLGRRRGRDGYNVASGGPTSSSGASEFLSNT